MIQCPIYISLNREINSEQNCASDLNLTLELRTIVARNNAETTLSTYYSLDHLKQIYYMIKETYLKYIE
jgi:hypothetical protein